MKSIIDFLYQNQALHWAAALAGIISLLLIRVIKVKSFSWKVWVNDNLIGFIWSLFFLSLTVTLTAVYNPGYSLIEAYLTGYCGTHVILRLNKEPKNFDHPGKFPHRNQNR
jgi:ABC-type Mn2+/Zn2+ transport system permease subunit